MLIAKNKNISIQLDSAEKQLFFNFDEHYLGEVINNLLTNSIKFSKHNSAITIKITKKKRFIKTEVIDEGQGIPLDEQTNLFHYFQKTSVQPTDGENSTGLGLAICKKIITEHKGTIGVLSEFGKGSNFYFELPIN
jgi:signal transduction histidine kinase